MGIFGARGASGSRPYLKVTGPPPLRFEPVAVDNADFLALLTLPEQRESSITNMPPPKPESARAETYTSGGTLAPVISNGGFPYGMFPFGFFPFGMSPYGMGPWGASSMGMYPPPVSTVPTRPAGIPSSSASNMLSVPSQMINNYLQPNPTTPQPPTQYQPGESIMVPEESGFVPPAPPQSQSSYNSK
jgi:hypothetical protein